jgi:glycosyltransferase involved in cell wall biosynthesis
MSMVWAADCEITTLGPGVARVAGWALPPDGPIRRVEILGGDAHLGRAIVGAYRRGVAERSDRPDAPVSGFARTVAVGRATAITVRAVSTGGSMHTFAPQPVAPAAPSVALSTTTVPRQSPGGPLRIAAYGDYARAGGAQRVLADLLRGLTVRGIDCRLLTPTPEAAGPAAGAVPCEQVPEPPLSDPAAFDRWVEDLARRLGERDVLIVDTYGAFAGVGAAQHAGIPAVWAIHESVPPAVWIADEAARRDIDPEVARHFERALGAAVARVFVSQRAEAAFGAAVPGTETVTLPYGIDTAALARAAEMLDRDELRRRRGFDRDDVVVACLSMVGFGKGQARLAQAFDRLADRHPAARLVMVGDRGLRYADGIREFIRRSGRGDRISVLPVADDVVPWHVAADVVLLASSVEMLPRVMVEAMTIGRPVAATDIFGAGEHIIDGETGYLCEPDDLDALTSMLDRVLTAGPGAWKRIAAAARPLIPQRLDVNRWIDGWVELLRAAVEAP